jgi:uncharacterized protein DUF1573
MATRCGRWNRWAAVAAVVVTLPVAAKGNEKEPKTVVHERSIDLGIMREGETKSATFVIENQGTADLNIRSVRTSCGCTIPRKLTAEESRVEPGESVEILATFDSKHRRGKQRKTVTVETNDPIEPNLKLFLSADVISLIEVLANDRPARQFSFRRLQPGSTVSRTIDVLPTEPNQSLELNEIEIRHEALTYSTEPVSRDSRSGVRIRLRVDDGASLGEVITSLLLTAKVGDNIAKTSLKITGEVIGAITFRPAMIKQLVPRLRGNGLIPVNLSAVERTPFEILSADAGDRLRVEIKKTNDSTYILTCHVRDDAPAGPFGTYLNVRTNLVEQPVIRIPVFGWVQPDITVAPPIVYLTEADTSHKSRLVKLESTAHESLTLESIKSDSPYLKIVEVESPGRKSKATKFIRVSMTDAAPNGTHHLTIRVKTNMQVDAEVLIPVTIVVQ